ncbi:hypothetical protein [Nostoc sp.]|uniref:hypothetical protein n=1 Tax=Nostoc sp. TaxID=1180 RepID=UPI002FF913F3
MSSIYYSQTQYGCNNQSNLSVLGTGKILFFVGTKTLGDACCGLRQRIPQLWRTIIDTKP